jgi:hypothetical protein
VVEAVDTFKVAAVVAGFGLKVPLAPTGSPARLRLTDPVKPLLGVMVTEYEVAFPWLTVRLEGEALRLKSCGLGALTTSVADMVWLRLPSVPVIVSV